MSDQADDPEFFILEWYERGGPLKPGEYRLVSAKLVNLTGGRAVLEVNGSRMVTSPKDPSRRFITANAAEVARRAIADAQSPNPDKVALAREALRVLPVSLAEVIARPTTPPRSHNEPLRLAALTSHGETERVEFKESLLWALDDVRPNIERDAGEKVAIVEIAGFANGLGGHLIVGVDDGGNVVGIERDLRRLSARLRRTATTDEWELRFRTRMSTMCGPPASALVTVEFIEALDLTVAVLAVVPSNEPVFVKDGNNVDLPLRTGNEVRRLNVFDAITYYRQRFAGDRR